MLGHNIIQLNILLDLLQHVTHSPHLPAAAVLALGSQDVSRQAHRKKPLYVALEVPPPTVQKWTDIV